MFSYPMTPQTIWDVILVILQNVSKGKEIKDYLVQPIQYTNRESKNCTAEWDKRTVQRC